MPVKDNLKRIIKNEKGNISTKYVVGIFLIVNGIAIAYLQGFGVMKGMTGILATIITSGVGVIATDVIENRKG